MMIDENIKNNKLEKLEITQDDYSFCFKQIPEWLPVIRQIEKN